jgi:hypothetical protein
MSLLDKVAEEPVRTAILGFVTAAIALLVAFGVALTAAQIAAIAGFVGAILLLTEVVVRKTVTPLANPKTATGEPLVPISDAVPALEPLD